MFGKLDDFLLDRFFQKTANWVQLNIGYDCFLLSRFCLSIYALTLIVSSVMDPVTLTYTEARLPLAVFYFVLLSSALYISHKVEYLCKTGVGAGSSTFVNPLKSRSLLRIFFIVSSVVGTAGDLMSIFFAGKRLYIAHVLVEIFSVGFIYYLSCTPLPPAKSKAKEFIENIFSKLIPVKTN